MVRSIGNSKSLMLAPICDGDQVAAAILDYLYLFFQEQNNPYRIFVSMLQKRNEEVIDDDLLEFYIDQYPEKWLLTSLAELYRAIHSQWPWENAFLTKDILAGLRCLQNKGYLCIEHWGLSEEEIDDYLQAEQRETEHNALVDSQMSCWLYQGRVDNAVVNYYSDHLVMPSFDEHIDVKREKRIVSSQVHRAKRIGQAASLTFEEWAETLRYFNLCCAFCQTKPYEVLEHFTPIIHGGSTSVFNCIPACETCNAIKNDRVPHEFAQDMGEIRTDTIQHYLQQRRELWLKKRQKI